MKDSEGRTVFHVEAIVCADTFNGGSQKPVCQPEGKVNVNENVKKKQLFAPTLSTEISGNMCANRRERSHNHIFVVRIFEREILPFV